jgi:hypothetical protein
VGVLLLRIISGSRRFYIRSPRALSEWLNLAKRPFPDLASSLHRRSSLFDAALGLMTAFGTGAWYLITKSSCLPAGDWCALFSHRRDGPPGRISSWASCSEGVRIVLGQHVTSANHTRTRATKLGASPWHPGRESTRRKGGKGRTARKQKRWRLPDCSWSRRVIEPGITSSTFPRSRGGAADLAVIAVWHSPVPEARHQAAFIAGIWGIGGITGRDPGLVNGVYSVDFQCA